MEDELNFKNYSKEEALDYVDDCCERMLLCQKRLESAKEEYRQINHYLADIKIIDDLGGERWERLSGCARRVVNLKEDKKSYGDNSIKMSEKKFEYFRTNENKIGEILKDLKESEDEFTAVKTDIHQIEAEKSALLYERDSSKMKANLTRRIFVTLAVLTVLVLSFFFFVQSQGEYDCTIGIYITIVTSMAAIAGILVFRQSAEKDLTLAGLKLNKAINLLNRYKLRYVNLKSSLDYMYDMYGIGSSYEFSRDYGTYLTVKKEREAYFKMSDSLYEATEEYGEMINGLGLFDPSVWSYQINALVDDREMKVIKDTLNNRLVSVKKNIEYNTGVIENIKTKVKELTVQRPELTDSIMAVLDEKEKSIS